MQDHKDHNLLELHINLDFKSTQVKAGQSGIQGRWDGQGQCEVL